MFKLKYRLEKRDIKLKVDIGMDMFQIVLNIKYNTRLNGVSIMELSLYPYMFNATPNIFKFFR